MRTNAGQNKQRIRCVYTHRILYTKQACIRDPRLQRKELIKISQATTGIEAQKYRGSSAGVRTLAQFMQHIDVQNHVHNRLLAAHAA